MRLIATQGPDRRRCRPFFCTCETKCERFATHHGFATLTSPPIGNDAAHDSLDDFWTHLICGVAIGLVVLMMSVTGVILTYERQMLAWAERDDLPGTGRRRAAADARGARRCRQATPPRVHAGDDHAAQRARRPRRLGRRPQQLARRRSVFGRGQRAGRARAASLFRRVTGWHRWFNATGDSRPAARAITGAAISPSCS